MSWDDKVIWSEGMFLQPQHFQQHDRYLERLLEGRTAPLQGHGWGFTRIELDAAALAIGKIQLASARGIFPDGTPFDFPQSDLTPSALDIGPEQTTNWSCWRCRCAGRARTKPAMATMSVHADPLFRRRHRREGLERVGSRQRADTSRALAMRLALKRDTADAYATLGVVRVKERRADNQVVLHQTYIPPVLDVRRPDPCQLCPRPPRPAAPARRSAGHAAGPPGSRRRRRDRRFPDLQTINRYEPLFAHLDGPLARPSGAAVRDPAGTRRRPLDLQPREPAPMCFPLLQHDDLEGASSR